jgi:hypothetical protein
MTSSTTYVLSYVSGSILGELLWLADYALSSHKYASLSMSGYSISCRGLALDESKIAYVVLMLTSTASPAI